MTEAERSDARRGGARHRARAGGLLARLAAGQAQVQLLLNGVDSNTAAPLTAMSGSHRNRAQQKADRAGSKSGAGAWSWCSACGSTKPATSTWYLVPGLIVLVMTLIGAFLTSLLIAREWERGTLESLFRHAGTAAGNRAGQARALPVGRCHRPGVCACSRRVPVRRADARVAVGDRVCLAAVPDGIAAAGPVHLRQDAQPVPGEPGGLLVSFMPAMMLSGFVFDLRNVPVVVQVGQPATAGNALHGLIKTLFWPVTTGR
jgi:ABC-2 type transport system permease protein